MRDEMRDLVSSSFLAFSLKAFATLNAGKELPTDPYLELLAARLAGVASGEHRRLVVNLPPRHSPTPAWRDLPEDTRDTLTGLMARLILEHARIGTPAVRTEDGHDH